MSRIELYRTCAMAGMTVAETATKVGVTTTAVCQANRKYDLGFPALGPRRDLDACRAQLEALLKQGKTKREAAFEMNVPFNTIRGWCRDWKLFAGKGVRKPVMELIGPHLNQAEMADLKFLRTRGYTYRNAIIALKRKDLLELFP